MLAGHGVVVNWLRSGWRASFWWVLVPSLGGRAAAGGTGARGRGCGATGRWRWLRQGATRARLGVLGDAFDCADARFRLLQTQRRGAADCRPVVRRSQLWADAVLLHVASRQTGNGDPLTAGWDVRDTQCYLDKGFVFLDRLWDYTKGRVFPARESCRRDVDQGGEIHGRQPHCRVGAARCCARVIRRLAVRRYVHALAAKLISCSSKAPGYGTRLRRWLLVDTGRGDSQEGKPAQTNALAALFFARLYAATTTRRIASGRCAHCSGSTRSCMTPAATLYRWSVSFTDIPHRTGASLSQRLLQLRSGHRG